MYNTNLSGYCFLAFAQRSVTKVLLPLALCPCISCTLPSVNPPLPINALRTSEPVEIDG